MPREGANPAHPVSGRRNPSRSAGRFLLLPSGGSGGCCPCLGRLSRCRRRRSRVREFCVRSRFPKSGGDGANPAAASGMTWPAGSLLPAVLVSIVACADTHGFWSHLCRRHKKKGRAANPETQGDSGHSCPAGTATPPAWQRRSHRELRGSAPRSRSQRGRTEPGHSGAAPGSAVPAPSPVLSPLAAGELGKSSRETNPSQDSDFLLHTNPNTLTSPRRWRLGRRRKKDRTTSKSLHLVP
ncbi:uncharacterized protein LOC120509679 isoform X2 [Passer montanus]|uniref:uncharacterized protein LOC120509679 isoform X2 n=1 Tax=Passer montanus TaxID=9160 RepID=UPI00195FE04C|nr:uncharacterized protein LOC120509679 isoform X2 [Passer montanus]